MTPIAVLETAALMGLFVLAGGSYGGFYSIGRLWASRPLLWAGAACCVIAIALAATIAVVTPLDLGWKLLILASAAVYVVIPPATWRYVDRLHVGEEPRQ